MRGGWTGDKPQELTLQPVMRELLRAIRDNRQDDSVRLVGSLLHHLDAGDLLAWWHPSALEWLEARK